MLRLRIAELVDFLTVKTELIKIIMEWYVPMTILPGLGLIILSTSNFLISLNGEIMQLCEDIESNREIIDLKVIQMKRLSVTMSFLYSSVLSFLLAGLSGVTNFVGKTLFQGLMIVGVGFVTIAIIVLLIYSIKAVGIRQQLLKNR